MEYLLIIDKIVKIPRLICIIILSRIFEDGNTLITQANDQEMKLRSEKHQALSLQKKRSGVN